MQPGGVILVPLEESAPELWSSKIQRAWMLESWGPQREVGACGVYGQPLRLSPAANSGILIQGSENLLEIDGKCTCVFSLYFQWG